MAEGGEPAAGYIRQSADILYGHYDNPPEHMRNMPQMPPPPPHPAQMYQMSYNNNASNGNTNNRHDNGRVYDANDTNLNSTGQNPHSVHTQMPPGHVYDITSMIHKMSTEMNSQFANIHQSLTKLHSIETDVSCIKTNIMNLEQDNSVVKTKLNEIDKFVEFSSGMFDEFENTKTKLKETKAENKYVYSEVMALKRENKALKDHTLELQCRQMQNNLLFFGIPEAERFWEEKSEDVLIKFLTDKVVLNQQDGPRVHGIQFDRVHRLGAHKPQSRPRPIVAAFQNYKDREFIKRNSVNLDRNYSIKEHFPREIEDRRKKLYPIMRRYQADKRNKVRLVRDKLYVNEFLFDDDNPGGVRVSRNSHGTLQNNVSETHRYSGGYMPNSRPHRVSENNALPENSNPLNNRQNNPPPENLHSLGGPPNNVPPRNRESQRDYTRNYDNPNTSHPGDKRTVPNSVHDQNLNKQYPSDDRNQSTFLRHNRHPMSTMTRESNPNDVNHTAARKIVIPNRTGSDLQNSNRMSTDMVDFASPNPYQILSETDFPQLPHRNKNKASSPLLQEQTESKKPRDESTDGSFIEHSPHKMASKNKFPAQQPRSEMKPAPPAGQTVTITHSTNLPVSSDKSTSNPPGVASPCDRGNTQSHKKNGLTPNDHNSLPSKTIEHDVANVSNTNVPPPPTKQDAHGGADKSATHVAPPSIPPPGDTAYANSTILPGSGQTPVP